MPANSCDIFPFDEQDTVIIMVPTLYKYLEGSNNGGQLEATPYGHGQK